MPYLLALILNTLFYLAGLCFATRFYVLMHKFDDYMEHVKKLFLMEIDLLNALFVLWNLVGLIFLPEKPFYAAMLMLTIITIKSKHKAAIMSRLLINFILILSAIIEMLLNSGNIFSEL